MIQILVDMNLSPRWVEVFGAAGYTARHWSDIGPSKATDEEIMRWVREHGFVVLTHDLDFSAILASTRAEGPSVVQVRAQDVLPDTLGSIVLNAIRQFDTELGRGALVSVDPARAKARILPLRE